VVFKNARRDISLVMFGFIQIPILYQSELKISLSSGLHERYPLPLYPTVRVKQPMGMWLVQYYIVTIQ